MKTQTILARTNCAVWLLPLLLLLAIPAAALAQDYTWTTNNGAITITGYTGPGGDVSIPGNITGLPVKIIGSHVLGPRYNCLISITIPNTVTSIEDEAFSFCKSLTNVIVPNSVTNIGNLAFLRSDSLAAISVDANNLHYCDVDGVLFDKSQATLIAFPGGKSGSYTISNSVTHIQDGAFDGCASLTGVAIPDSVTNIGDYAFAFCTGLTNATIGNSVTTIGIWAFYSCTSLADITIPSSVTSMPDEAFAHSGLVSVNIDSRGIGLYAFAGCTNLTSITIGNNVEWIGISAFAGCTSLTNVTVPTSIAIIGDEAFCSCTNLTNVHFRGNSPSVGYWSFDQATNATIYFLPGTTGWGPTFGGRPTALWQPQVQSSGPDFGVKTNQFGFNITWASGQVVVIEACTNLANPTWSPLQTNNLTADSAYFGDAQWTNYPSRHYRLRSQ
jgi:hypothetical protein